MAPLASSDCGGITLNGTLEETEGPSGFSPSELRAAYAVPATGGSTQTIAIVIPGDDPNAESDLAEYRSHYGLPPCTEKNGCFRKRDENGGTEYPPASEKAAVEISIDLDMASAACPECHLLLVEAEDKVLSLMKAEDRAVLLGATVVSNSWGYKDDETSAGMNSHFEHAGVPITAASGDFGHNNYLDKEMSGAPSYPAAAPSVIAVGGTKLTKAASTPRGWKDNVWAKSGGGCSIEQAKPAWQEDIGCENRLTNDVAVVAEGVTAYSTYGKSNGWQIAGGTSVGAPFVAGIFAHASKAVREEPSEALYFDLAESVGTVLDVTPQEGLNNTNYPGHSCSYSYECNAVAGEDGESFEGYDGPTGVGIPQGPPTLALWSSASIPTPPSGELSTHSLYGVDCTKGDACTTVGYTYEPTEETSGIPLAMRWDGSEWNAESVPSPVTGLGSAELFAVSCPSLTSCAAVGSQWSLLTGGEPMIATWNGSGWSLGTPAAAAAKRQHTLVGVSCSSSTACIAVGRDSGTSTSVPLAERLNAGKWAAQEVPLPSGMTEGWLESVDCVSASSCIAVGWSASTTEGPSPLAEKWNGSTWKAMEVPSPGGLGELRSISCSHASECVAVGDVFGVPMAEHWDGESWEVRTPPPPAEAEEEGWASLYGVSCARANACSVIGYGAGGGGIFSFAESWNGVSWEDQPLQAEEGDSRMRGISCVAVDDCLSVGDMQVWEPEFSQTLVAQRFSE